jgi:medium-chain acyl-[acyl-carrier-protein] hydrolase
MTPSVWEEHRVVEAFEVDVRGRLPPHVLFSFLLSCAWNHAAAAGFSFQDLSERGLMWVLTKFQMSILRMPEWRDEIKLETWGKRIERLYALRDFRVSSPQGRRLAGATGAWMILDKRSYRPRKLEQLMGSFPWQEGKNELEGSLQKVAQSTNGQDRAHHRVRFSELDVNNHVNAANYLKWIMDSYPREVLENRQVESVEISFLAEATVDDEIAVHFERIDDQEINTIKRAGDQKDLCRAAIEWQKSV